MTTPNAIREEDHKSEKTKPRNAQVIYNTPETDFSPIVAKGIQISNSAERNNSTARKRQGKEAAYCSTSSPQNYEISSPAIV